MSSNAPLQRDKLFEFEGKGFCGFESRNRLLETHSHG
jgi:hypothetical protein